MFLCLLLEGFFAGSEIAIVSVNRAHLRHLVEKGSSRARALSHVLERPEWFLGTTLMGTNLCVVLFNALATLYVLERFGPRYELATILVTWPIILVFGEMVPKAFCQRYADRLARNLVYPLKVISWVLSPLVVLFAGFASLFAKIAHVRSQKRTPLVTREELELIFLASEQKSGVKELEQRMIRRIFSFAERPVREVMIPLAEVVAVAEEATLQDAVAELRRSGFSRVPIFSGRVFNVVGWIGHFDLLQAGDKSLHVREIVRPIRFAPASMEVNALMVAMQRSGDTLAAVVDEFGGTIGLVTMEDLIEEVVGSIEDEHDTDTTFVRRLDSSRILVSARISVEDAAELMRHPIPQGDYLTLGGFLLAKMQRIPKRGEVYRYRKLVFRVVEVTDRSISQVEIEHL